jgi:hypothetical protein
MEGIESLYNTHGAHLWYTDNMTGNDSQSDSYYRYNTYEGATFRQ